MCEITYNIKLNFENQEDSSFWLNLLNEEKDMFNFASKEVYNKKPKINQKDIADLLYNPIRNKAKFLNAQCVCKIEREIVSAFRTIKSNKHNIK